LNSRLRDALSGLTAFLLPALVGLGVHQQGLNLLDDGLWLLGGRLVSEGGVLYRDLFSIYGPARYFVLAPFLLLTGQKVVALAVMKAVIDGFAGFLGFTWSRRLGAGRWAWLVPLGVIAIAPVYPRYLAAAAFAMWITGAPWGERRPWLAGLFWGGLALFGLDMAAYGAVVLGAGWWTSGRPFRPLGQVAAGAGAVAVVTLLVAAVQGALGALWWGAVVYPATRFGGAMGVSWWGAFVDGALLGEVFAGHHTGEVFEAAWPGQSILRILGLRIMFLLAWILPVALLVTGHRRKDARLSVLAALGMAGWATLYARGDVEHLKLVWFALLLMVPVFLGLFAERRRAFAWIGLGVTVLALCPLAAEQAWLAANRGREGLVSWDRPGAGILLADDRRDALEEICVRIDGMSGDSVQVWPAQPGLHFVTGRRPALGQATLLPGEVKDDAALVVAVEAAQIDKVVLGPAWGLVAGVRSLRRLEPALYSNLRENYRLDHEVVLMGETYKFLARLSGGRSEASSLSPAVRLPGAAQYLKTGTTPALEPGSEVTQTFHVEDLDLAGLALMFTAPGPFPYRIDLELGILQMGAGGQATELAAIPLTVTLEQQAQKHSFPFRPIAGSRGRTMAFRVRDRSGGERPFALMWHKPDPEAGGMDFHPGGQVYLNGRPHPADLFFVTY
jgi:hypothetical protein